MKFSRFNSNLTLLLAQASLHSLSGLLCARGTRSKLGRAARSSSQPCRFIPSTPKILFRVLVLEPKIRSSQLIDIADSLSYLAARGTVT